MARRAQRFTIYDMMEQKGVFDANPANADAHDSTGVSIYKKAEFPMMVYHPSGDKRLAIPGEILATPLGPRKVGEQWRLIDKIVRDESELKEALAAGWHKTPGEATAIANGEELPKTQSQTIEELEARIAELQLERNTRNEEILSGASGASGAKAPAIVVKPKTTSTLGA